MEQWFVERLKEVSLGGVGVWIGVMVYLFDRIIKMVERWQANRKLSIEDKQANREGFTAQVEALQDEVNGLRTENRALRAEYSTLWSETDAHRKLCETETNQLRDTVVHLEAKLSGVLRKVAAIAVKITRKEVDQDVVASILELAQEAAIMSDGRDKS